MTRLDDLQALPETHRRGIPDETDDMDLFVHVWHMVKIAVGALGAPDARCTMHPGAPPIELDCLTLKSQFPLGEVVVRVRPAASGKGRALADVEIKYAGVLVTRNGPEDDGI